MKQIKSPVVFQKEMAALRRRGKSIGFVPTMGALHEGHLSLVSSARNENDIVAVSIFVNPIQFGPAEDFKKYPRNIARDVRLLRSFNVEYVFTPEARAMYPKGYSTVVQTGEKDRLKGALPLAEGLCGAFRPGHFAGVATVVAKLFHLAHPTHVYFGEKDFQQAVVIRQMIKDLQFDLKFRLIPTVREADGLAMSSRNQYLNEDERRRAAVLPQTLFWFRSQILSGRRDIVRLKQEAVKRLSGALKVQYFEVVDSENLQTLNRIQNNMTALAACYAGKTRLIDNVRISLKRR